MRVAERPKDLRRSRKMRKISKIHSIITQCPVPHTPAENCWKIQSEVSPHCTTLHKNQSPPHIPHPRLQQKYTPHRQYAHPPSPDQNRKHLPSVSHLGIIWFILKTPEFLYSLILNKFFMKYFLVENLCFTFL